MTEGPMLPYAKKKVRAAKLALFKHLEEDMADRRHKKAQKKLPE